MGGTLVDPKPSDVFALGVMFFTIVRGTFPFTVALPVDKYFKAITANNWALVWKTHEKQAKKTFSPEFKKLIEGMLAIDPNNRFSITDVVNSDFLAGLGNQPEDLPVLNLQARHTSMESRRSFDNMADSPEHQGL